VCPLYKVILHHNNNEITYITFALYYAVCNLTLCEAERIVLAAQLTGQAVVAVCPKEMAEYYHERMIKYRLTTTIEPD
jgi:ATP-dependent Clp protease adaptor protein ClpS